MPTYLIHGFRWQRAAIRIHIILHDLDDAAPEWVIAPATSATLLNSFYSLYDFLPPSNPPPASYPLPSPSETSTSKEEKAPKTLRKKKGSMASLGSLGRKSRPAKLEGGGANGNGHHAEAEPRKEKTSASQYPKAKAKKEKEPGFNEWSVVKFVEQYDPNDLRAISQPYAYVGDYLVEVKLGVSVNEEIARYEARQRAEEAPLASPASPASPGTPGTPNIGASGNLSSSGLSARDIRRKSRRLGWFEKLRDGLQKGADIGWFVVVCGDEERAAPSVERVSTSEETEEEDVKTPRSAGFRGFFGTVGRKKNVPEE